MISRRFAIFIVFTFVITSCQSQTVIEQRVDTSKSMQVPVYSEPNYNYIVEVPDGWTIRDTILNSMRLRFLLPPTSANLDRPMGNIIIASMEGRNIADFTSRNMDYLKLNLPGTMILKSGNIESTSFKGQWFTYTKEQNGVVRDMINYIIPIKGYAYMITCGSSKGSIKKYRTIFDKIAKSFKG